MWIRSYPALGRLQGLRSSSTPASRTRRGRAAHALLLVIPLVLVGVVAWLMMSSDLEPTRPPDGQPTTPTATEADAPVPIAEASDRTLAMELGSEPSSTLADDRPSRLRFEVVDAAGQPVQIVLDVDYSIQSGEAGRAPSPEHFSAQGPRVERALPDSFVSKSGREVKVVVRSGSLRGEGVVSTSRATDTTWPRIVLHPTFFVRGLLVDARGAPVEGVPILLRDDNPGKEAHARARTDAAGAFALEALPHVANRLFVGDAVYPWVPVIAIDAKNGPFVLEPIRVELHSASFRVQRADGAPASGARLEGIGLEGGRFGVTLDEDGRAAVTTLLRGRWRINASDATHGRASRAIEIPLTIDEPILILLPR